MELVQLLFPLGHGIPQYSTSKSTGSLPIVSH